MFNKDEELAEFRRRKLEKAEQLAKFTRARRAYEGDFDWPTNWPGHKSKIVVPLVQKAVQQNAAMLMGREFTFNVAPLGSGQRQREQAEKAEKALDGAMREAGAWQSMQAGAHVASLTGTAVFKVYWKKKKYARKADEWQACLASCQPEYFYPVPAGDDRGEIVKVYYSYSVDRLTAEKQYGKREYQTVRELGLGDRAETITELMRKQTSLVDDERKIPVLEVWTDQDYMLLVGGVEVKNEPNPFGFVPYEMVQNINSADGLWGLSDVEMMIDLNQQLNELLSEQKYITSRWQNPTVIWEDPPPDYASTLAGTLGGGGALPTKRGTNIRFLQYTGQGPDVQELRERLLRYAIDASGLNELSWFGNQGGSINTGPSLEIKYTNILAALALKQKSWEAGLRRLFAKWMHLLSMPQQGDICLYEDNAKSRSKRGEMLTFKDVGEHRNVLIVWPGALPKDDMASAQFELAKYRDKVQSLATTLQNLGFNYPQDEIERIREEAGDERLNPNENANLMRAGASMLKAQGGPEGMPPEAPEGEVAPPEEPEGDLGVDPGEEPPMPDTPDDLDQLTDTPVGMGSLLDGRVVDRDGQEVTGDALALARWQADRERNLPEIAQKREQGDMGSRRLPDAVEGPVY